MKMIRIFMVLVLVTTMSLFFSPQEAQAATKTWIGGTGFWDDDANWSPEGVPTSTDQIIIDGDGLTYSVVTLNFGFDIGGSLTIDEGDTLVISAGSTLTNGSLINNYGTIISDSGGSIFNDGGTVNSYGIINNGGSFSTSTASFINNYGIITNDGDISHGLSNFNNYGDINNNGTIENLGTIENGDTINNNGTIQNGGTIDNDGDINNNGTIQNGGTIDNDFSGTIINDGFIGNTGVIDNGGPIYNHPGGVIFNEASGTIENLSYINNTLGGLIRNDGTINNYCDAVFFQNGVFEGNPIIDVCNNNNPPIANDDSYSTLQDIPLNVDAPGVLENDSDDDNDALFVEDKTWPSNGWLTMNLDDGSFTYAPDSGFSGDDTFTYTVSDGNGGTDTALVTITVNPSAPTESLMKLDLDVVQAPIKNKANYHIGASMDGLPIPVTLQSAMAIKFVEGQGMFYEDITGAVVTGSLFDGHLRISVQNPDDCSFFQFVVMYDDNGTPH
ncbi:Ig-like domain-containing protein, partial [Chloroflexota bacterium]